MVEGKDEEPAEGWEKVEGGGTEDEQMEEEEVELGETKVGGE